MSEQSSAAEVVLEVFEAIESEFSIEPPIPKEITNLLHSRFTALVESERSRARAGFTYPHMCRDGHPEIGHSDNSSEMCPLCRARADVAERDKLLAEVRRQADQLGERYRIAAAGPGREFTAALVCGIGDKVSEVVAELVEALRNTLDALRSVQTTCAVAGMPPKTYVGHGAKAIAALAKHSEAGKVTGPGDRGVPSSAPE